MGTGTPQSVLDQEAAADAAIAAAEAEQNAAPVPAADPAAPASPAPDGEIVSLSEMVDTPPAPAAPAPAAAAPAGDTVPRSDYDRLMAQHHALQGKYNAEVPILSKRLSDMGAEIRAIRERPPAPAAPAVPPYLAHLSDEERQDYQNRNEALGVSGRAVLGEVEAAQAAEKAERDRLNARLDQIERDQQAQAGSSSVQSFINAVDQQLPGAARLNTSPGFNAFLATIDPASGLEWGILASSAADIGDVARGVDIFKTYMTQAGLTGNEAGGDVTHQIKPARAAGSPAQPGTPEPVKYINESEVKQFYQDVALGEYGPERENDPRAIKIQAVIDKAADEGRIIYGQ